VLYTKRSLKRSVGLRLKYLYPLTISLGISLGLLEFISEMYNRRYLPIYNIVFSPRGGYAVVYLKIKTEADRERVGEIAEVARSQGLLATVYVDKRDASGRRRNMVIVRQVGV
jgi:hypothetical protein